MQIVCADHDRRKKRSKRTDMPRKPVIQRPEKCDLQQQIEHAKAKIAVTKNECFESMDKDDEWQVLVPRCYVRQSTMQKPLAHVPIERLIVIKRIRQRGQQDQRAERDAKTRTRNFLQNSQNNLKKSNPKV